MIYFDHNATSPMLPDARRAWLEAAEQFIGNPSSPHRLGARAEAALQDARERLGRMLGCDALDLVWTSGATESGNAVMHHFARTRKTASGGWISTIEHPCVVEPETHYFRRHLQQIPVTRAGVVDLGWMGQHVLHAPPRFVAVMAANNETGVIQPWRELAVLCQERGLPFFCDATQWLGKLPAQGLGQCDFVSGSAHKFGGPRGVGFLKCPAKGRVKPLLRGGKQEEGRRAGTENVAGVLAMVTALEAREAAMKPRSLADAPSSLLSFSPSNPSQSTEIKLRLAWRGQFERDLLKSLPGSEIVGAELARLWNTVSALMPEADCQQRWVVKLDKLGFAVSTGSACASGREQPSRVLSAMGYTPAEAGRVLRFSSGWETTEADWPALLEALAEIRRQPVRV